MKVKYRLALIPHLLWVATPNELGIPEQITPRLFAETADKLFNEKFGIIPIETGY